jgi:hypothetical protein
MCPAVTVIRMVSLHDNRAAESRRLIVVKADEGDVERVKHPSLALQLDYVIILTHVDKCRTLRTEAVATSREI